MAVYDKTVLAGQTNVINVVAVLTLSKFHSFSLKSFRETEFFMPLSVPLFNVCLRI